MGWYKGWNFLFCLEDFFFIPSPPATVYAVQLKKDALYCIFFKLLYLVLVWNMSRKHHDPLQIVNCIK
ncbi:hypothetical protein E1A90_15085 [Bacillus mycoides]|nr:hypothetical protein E1A90_15085 [Bacillus mycoides]